jgi:hypothetical protein
MALDQRFADALHSLAFVGLVSVSSRQTKKPRTFITHHAERLFATPALSR